jgi:hypothetical protein
MESLGCLDLQVYKVRLVSMVIQVFRVCLVKQECPDLRVFKVLLVLMVSLDPQVYRVPLV